MQFKKWLEVWDFADEGGPVIPHNALPKSNIPPIRPGMIRLYRGTKIGELPHENAFFTDGEGLEGIAKAFAKIPGRHLVYVDVPIELAQKLSIGVTDHEYKIPEEYRRQVRIL